MISFIDQFTSALAITLLQSLWQVAVIGILVLGLIVKTKSSRPTIVYHACISGVALAIILFMLTFGYYWWCFDTTGWASLTSSYVHSSAITSLDSLDINDSTSVVNVKNWLFENQSRIIFTYVIGLALFSFRLMIALRGVSVLRSSNNYTQSSYLTTALNRLLKDLSINQSIRVGVSQNISSPLVVGHFRPLILFPIALVNHLTVEETEAILAHEIAHILRNDYLQNLILTIAEAIFFYHPVIWIIAYKARIEREKICDDFAIRISGGNMIYAKSLLKIQELHVKNENPRIAMAIKKGEGGFLDRIKRILNQKTHYNMTKEKTFISALLLILSAGFLSANYLFKSENSPVLFLTNEDVAIQNESEELRFRLADIDTLEPMIDRKNIQSVNAHYSDGEISFLSINGKVIKPEEYWKYEGMISPPPAPPAPPSAPAPPRAVNDLTYPAPPAAPTPPKAPRIKELQTAPFPSAPPAPPRATPPSPPRAPKPPRQPKSERSGKYSYHIYYNDTIPSDYNNGNTNWNYKLESINDDLTKMTDELRKLGQDIGQSYEERFGENFTKKITSWTKRFEDGYSRELERDVESWGREIERWARDLERKHGKNHIVIDGDVDNEEIEVLAEGIAEWAAHLSEHIGESVAEGFTTIFDNSNRPVIRSSADNKSMLIQKLREDGFLNEDGKIKVELTNQKLTINGKSQSQTRLKEYQNIFTSNSDDAFRNDTEVKFEAKIKNGLFTKQSLSISIDD